jgi:hypothetical protein
MQAPSTPETKTDSEGWFRFENLHPAVELIAFKGTGALISRVVDNAGPHYLSFLPGKTLEGVVQDEEGNALSNVQLNAFVRPNRAAALQMGSPVQGVSHSDGNFSIGPIAPGTSILLEASLSGFRPVRKTVLVEETNVVDFTTLVMKKGESLSGSIVSIDGKPLSNVLLIARQRDGISMETYSSSNGVFEIDGLGRGEIQLSAQLPGYMNRSLSLSETKSGVQLQLKKAHTVDGRITPVQTGLYAVVVEGNSRFRTPIAADGTFHLSRISTGEVKIFIESQDRNILASRQVRLDETLASLSISLK